MSKTRSVVILLLLALLLLIATAHVYAGDMDVTGFPSMTGDCIGSLTIEHSFYIEGQTDDTGTGRDALALVLYDGAGSAFAYIGIGVNVGGSGTISSWFWYYPFLAQPQSRPFTMRIFDNTTVIGTGLGDIAGAQHGTIVDIVHFDPVNYGVCGHLPLYTPPSEPGLQPVFFDGRINNYDAAAPVAVYGLDRSSGRGLIVYAINENARGYEALLADAEHIAAVPECPEQNTLIAGNETLGVYLYRLASCEFQINAPDGEGKTYTLIFAHLYPNTGYTSFSYAD